MLPLVLLLLHSSLVLPHQSSPQACDDAASCRAAALDARAREEFERFHDLAWRAVQKGRPNDPGLMELLARAQSLSGRPGDALVMLRRLAERGIAIDARESDDFRRVRALPGWPELEALIAKAGDPPGADSAAVPAAVPIPVAPPAAPPVDDAARPGPDVGARAPGVKPPPGATAEASRVAAKRPSRAGEETLALNDRLLQPVGLAYDSASQRFIVGDAHTNRLLLADEVFKHVNNLIGAASGGFGAVTAIAVDERRGDLWVASNGPGGTASIHKLQLVSGRVLSAVDLPENMLPASVRDIAVDGSGSVLAVDASGGRLLTVNGRTVRSTAALDLKGPVSVAPAGGLAYLAHEGGLALVDLKSGRTTAVRAAEKLDLRAIQRIRAAGRDLVAIQSRTDAPGGRLVRISLERGGTRAVSVDPIDPDVVADGTALTVVRDAAFYVARTDRGPVIRRVPLR